MLANSAVVDNGVVIMAGWLVVVLQKQSVVAVQIQAHSYVVLMLILLVVLVVEVVQVIAVMLQLVNIAVYMQEVVVVEVWVNVFSMMATTMK